MHMVFTISSWSLILRILYVSQPDTVTGDIVVVLQQKEHPKFKRKGEDLFVEHTLSLTEALCGFQFVITHLDGRQLLIKSHPGEVVKPGKYFGMLTFISWLSSMDCLVINLYNFLCQIHTRQSMMRGCPCTRGLS